VKLKKYLSELSSILDKTNEEQVEIFIDLLNKAYHDDKMIFVIGNGGSAATASHFAQDLAKGTRNNINQGKRFRALSLTDNVSFITALANDDGYDIIYEQQLRTFARPGDLLIAISGSGNSPNIIKAVNWANSNDLITIGVTGFDGGKLKNICKYSVHVPLNDMFITESIHSIIFHYIITRLIKLNNEN
jgi:D-sedoheptulose 7-phosphate isomerase